MLNKHFLKSPPPRFKSCQCCNMPIIHQLSQVWLSGCWNEGSGRARTLTRLPLFFWRSGHVFCPKKGLSIGIGWEEFSWRFGWIKSWIGTTPGPNQEVEFLKVGHRVLICPLQYDFYHSETRNSECPKCLNGGHLTGLVWIWIRIRA